MPLSLVQKVHPQQVREHFQDTADDQSLVAAETGVVGEVVAADTAVVPVPDTVAGHTAVACSGFVVRIPSLQSSRHPA